MKNFVMAPLVALMIWAGAAHVWAADKNKCGCYKNGADVCFCDKKAKCGCPGDCEPKGCDEAREKQIQKEIEAETKKAADADRRHTSPNGAKGSANVAKGSSGDKGEEPMKSASATEAHGGRKLTAAQAKQLVKLLDLYFAENPDARTRNVEEIRNQISQSH